MCAVGVFRGCGLAVRAAVACARFGINVVYRACCLLPRRDEVLFFSRQTNEPSDDFVALGNRFAARGWQPVYLTKKLSARSAVAYTGFALREIYHLARCRACVIDRYDPVVSLCDFRCEAAASCEAEVPRDAGVSRDAEVPRGAAAGGHGLPIFDAFPVEPLVVQVWHAFGAFKKFGYQSLGTPESHPVETARIFRIHRNCSWVLCSGEGARAAFAEAFNVPVERVVALPRPEYLKLAALADVRCEGAGGGADGGDGATGECAGRDVAAGADGCGGRGGCAGDAECVGRTRRIGRADVAGVDRRPQVLFAPTLRKSHESAHPLRDLHESGQWRVLDDFAQVTWSFHPLEATGLAAVDVNEALLEADYVVTDYSSIVYEAALLGKRVLFYVPDLDEYRASPGLNADPGELCPDLCFSTSDDLARALREFVLGSRDYPADQFAAFARTAFDDATVEASPDCIVEFVLGRAGGAGVSVGSPSVRT